MKVLMFTLGNGLEEIENVKYIRIVSKEYNLLIMKDYMPIIGSINGSVDIVTDEFSKKLENINAYYVNRSNIFRLIIKE